MKNAPNFEAQLSLYKGAERAIQSEKRQRRDAALELLAMVDAGHVTVTALAAGVGVNRGNIYRWARQFKPDWRKEKL